jgi:Enhancer of rudimentary
MFLCLLKFCGRAGVCAIYEKHLREQYPNEHDISYNMDQLFEWIDTLVGSSIMGCAYELSCLFLGSWLPHYLAHLNNAEAVQGDLSALVYDSNCKAYIPYNKEWIKSTAILHLKKQGMPDG